jgi:hypothetical protein
MPSKQATASPARKAATAPKRADAATTTATSAKKNGAGKSTEHAASPPKLAKAVKVVNVSSILVTHAAPSDENSPYHQIQRQYGVKFDFQNFIEIAGVPTPEFRKQNIHPLEYTAVIFTSKHSVDHFFRICRDLRIEMPAEAKYFCVSDSTA